ncbi:hypothetical protein PAMP_002332 [Pampus punctatissimus]
MIPLGEDDVDLEALVNDMNSSLESLYSTCSGQQTESTPLLHNGQTPSSHQHHHHLHHHTQHIQPRQGQHLHALSHVSPETPSSSSSSTDSPQTGLRRSQPMHILAVRRLQEEQQLRTSSLPAIPNPFPELCSPASSPVLSPGSLPPGEPSTGKYLTPWPGSMRMQCRAVRNQWASCLTWPYDPQLLNFPPLSSPSCLSLPLTLL